MTKTQQRANASKRSKRKRVAAALKKFVRSNPALPAALRKAKVVGMRANKGGKSVTIRVVKLKVPKG